MRRVILIAGHNGAGTGAKKFIDEGAETIRLRDALVDWLRVKCPSLQATTDRGRNNLTLAGGLLKWLKSFIKKEDICLDLHFNAANGTATGTEVIVPDKYSQIEFGNAKELSEAISKALQIKNRGVKTESQSQHSKLAMLSGFDCENFLAEICFVDNQQDADNYKKHFPELLVAIGNWLIQVSEL
jgi:N-acetylmuramoyl-L-alanine amidase